MREALVSLSAYEVRIAELAAKMRSEDARRRGQKGHHGAPDGGDGAEIDLLGCICEMAVAKHYGVFWAGNVGVIGGIDVPLTEELGFEVRGIPSLGRRLILHPGDRDDLPFILAWPDRKTGVHLLGWIRGEDGKRSEWWDDPTGEDRPAYFVPQLALRPMRKLTLKTKLTMETEYA